MEWTGFLFWGGSVYSLLHVSKFSAFIFSWCKIKRHALFLQSWIILYLCFKAFFLKSKGIKHKEQFWNLKIRIEQNIWVSVNVTQRVLLFADFTLLVRSGQLKNICGIIFCLEKSAIEPLFSLSPTAIMLSSHISKDRHQGIESPQNGQWNNWYMYLAKLAISKL